jgi:tetratricopeptide (TPR) repeat protein
MARSSAWLIAAAALAATLWLHPVAASSGRQGADASAAALRAEGLEAGFNLDYDVALRCFQTAIATEPDHPAGYRLAAAVHWIELMWRQGTFTVDDYLGTVNGDLKRPPPAPELAAAFRHYADQAIARAEARLRHHPVDADAHFQVGAAYGLLTSYQQTIEGRVTAGIRTARRAYREQERALALNPARKDAGLQLGIYRYGVSTLPLPLRLLAGIAGLGGGRKRGIALVEAAAAFPSDLQANARFTLIAIYTRERRFDDALAVIVGLQHTYPRNRLLWFEAASAALRAGRPGEARRWLAEGLAKLAHDSRPRASGEEVRWQRLQAQIAAAAKAGAQ